MTHPRPITNGYLAPIMQQPLSLSRIRALVFDLDGTLAHSNPDFPAMRAALGLASEADILGHIAALPEWQAAKAMAVVQRFELEAAIKAEWIAGARELMHFLVTAGVPTAILTRTCKAAAQETLNRLQLKVDMLLTREDAPPKPDPTGLNLLIERLGLMPAEVLYVGDYLFDLQTAERAACPSALYCTGPLPAYGAMADVLVPCYFGLRDALNAHWGGNT